MYYRGADGCVLMFDVTDESSFKELGMTLCREFCATEINPKSITDFWREQILKYADPVIPDKFPFVLIGNKVDLPGRKISANKAERWCERRNDIFYLETSAKRGLNVEHSFRVLSKLILEYANLEEPIQRCSSRFFLNNIQPPEDKCSC